MLRNNTIIITGGGSGIGKALALQVANDNTVVICGRREDALKTVASQHKNISYEVVDLSDYNSIENFFCSLKGKGIVSNVLFNNAGVVELWDVTKQSLSPKEIFDKISTNLSGAIAFTQCFITQADPLIENLIVNNTSEIAIMPVPILPLYSASKTGLSIFTKVLRVQLQKTKFKVIELLPPGVETDMPKKLGNTARLITPDAFAKKVIQVIKRGKLEYAGGKNVILFRLFQKFLPTLGLTIIDKLSRRQLLGK